ncbi:hypothetical protein [Streptomyces sp. NPDC056061]|uniref:hypothetical protein n=1 Tax=Streptomyces sp. NPDC056061 TaxID=3345700 RepID=UPI0035DF90FC
MNGVHADALDVSRVAKGKKFNSGGQGAVWAVEGRVMNGSWRVAYKEYHSVIRRELKPDVLAAMVAFIPSLPYATGQWLAECTAWPAVLVKDSEGLSGFLMRQIPDQYFRRLDFAPDELHAAGFQYLLNPPHYFRTAGIDITVRQRFELLLDLARTLARLHSLGVVVGDVSPNNVLFSLEGTPSCFLIDCDAMVLNGRSALPTLETPEWNLPSGERLGSTTGDVYKLGLLAARLFAGQQDGKDLTNLRAANPAVGQLAERSLSADPAGRPSAEDWQGALATAAVTAPTTLPRAAPPQTPAPPNGTRPGPAPAGTPPPQQAVPNTPPRTPRTAGPPTGAKPGAGRWFLVVVLIILALLFGPGLLEKAEKGLGSDGSGQSGRSSQSGRPGQDTGTDGTDGTDTSDRSTELDQARGLGDLLDRNKGNRGGVGEAVRQMTTCPGSSGLRDAKAVFEKAATERDELLRDLAALDRDLLPGSMVDSLETGWRASADADRAYASLSDEVQYDCTPEDVTSSSQWEEASRANTRATGAKKDFASAWNDLAQEHGLDTVSWDEL